jgi:hypothetical protein
MKLHIASLTLGLVMVSTLEVRALDLGPRDFGLRGGVSVNPDQGYGGLQFQLGRGLLMVGSDRHLALRPSLDVGLGNGVRLLTIGGDFLIPFGKGSLRPYVGAGPGVNLIDVTDGVGEADGMQAELVGHAIAGVRFGGKGRYLLEARAGLGDTPDFKVGLGLIF